MAIARKTPAPAVSKPAESKSEPSKSDASKPGRAAAGKSTAAKAATAKHDAPKVQGPKAQEPKAGAAKAQSSKPPAPKPAAGKSAAASVISPSLLDNIQIPSLAEAPEAAAEIADELKEQVRRVAEQNAEQTRQLYEQLKNVTEQTTGSLGTSYAAASRGIGELHLKTMEILKANADSNLEFVKALLSAKSLSEAVVLQGQHARAQFEALTEQAKDLSALAQRVATEAVEPMKSGLKFGLPSST